MEMNAKVLVADDDDGYRDMVCDYLEGEGYTVIKAGDGCEAYDIAIEEDPDVLLLDIAMPLRNGYEVCRKLKDDERLRGKCKVVIHSAKISFTDRLTGYLSGASRYLCKPCDLDEIGDCIELVMKQREASRVAFDGVEH